MIVLKDKDFIRGDVPMTKEEIRVLSMSKLALEPSDIVVDIGGGSGAMAINIAKNLPIGMVTTIECKAKAIELIEQNRKQLRVNNLEIINGTAPKDLKNQRVDKVFIGGSNGYLSEIFDYLDTCLKPKGLVVLNFITLENIIEAMNLLKQNDYEIDIIQATISKGKQIKDLTMMKTHNTITIITGRKGV